MKAIILAAGRGSRMNSLTDDLPKCLLEVEGKPLLQHQINALSSAGITDISIVTGYKRELLQGRGLVEFYNARWNQTNMVYSLSCASEWLNADSCIISYSDIYYSEDCINKLVDNDSIISLTYDPQWLDLWEARFEDPLSDAETFKIGQNSYLTEIGNKPNSVDEIEGQYMGLLHFKPEGWRMFSDFLKSLTEREFDRISMTAALQMLILEKRASVKAVPCSTPWGEFDNANDLKIYKSFRKNNL